MAAKPVHSSGLDMFNQVKMPEGDSPKEVWSFLVLFLFFTSSSFSSLLPLLLFLLETNQNFFLRDDSAYPICWLTTL